MIALPPIVQRLTGALRRFRRDRSAAAAVEFALILPFLITLYMGTIEISDLIAVDRRVNVVAGTVGDLVARTDTNIPASDMTDYFKASEGIIMPYSKTGLRQVVSLVAVNGSGATTVKWSQAYNGGTARTVGQPFPGFTATSPIVTLALNGYIIVGESSYAYRPLLGWVIKTAINLHRESYYLPRYGGCIKYNGSGCT